LSFVPSIEVPADAWIDWDAAQQRFVTVGQQHPEGLTARTRTVVYYKDDLYSLEWHDGSKMTLGDMVVGFILGLDRAKPASAIYDEAEVSSLQTFLGHFRGLRILQEDPLVVEVYSNHISPDAETIAGSRAGYLFTSTPWPGLALGILAEQNHQLAFSSNKADQLKVEWMSYIAGPGLPVLERYLARALADGFIPYQKTAGQYISAAEAQDRFRRLSEFYQARGHFWVGQGPFYLFSVYPTEKNVVIRRFDPFPDPPHKWQRFIEPRIPEVNISGPGRISSGQAARFQVEVTFQGAPYAVDDIELARFLVLDARGEVVVAANVQPQPDGVWLAELTPEQTAELETGSTRLEVAVVSRSVSIPTFESFSFVTIGP
jgi:peptide/nickel transport system substrate-binding protein